MSIRLAAWVVAALCALGLAARQEARAQQDPAPQPPQQQEPVPQQPAEPQAPPAAPAPEAAPQAETPPPADAPPAAAPPAADEQRPPARGDETPPRRRGEGRERPQRPEGREQPAPALPAEWLKEFQWRSIGPANMSGRISALAVYEADPSIWWVATASGGLLKTSNNGVTFEHQFDREKTVSIGDVAVAPSDPNIVWVGTGEGNPRNSVSYGDGVYKSLDGGKTWKRMGLQGSFQIGRIAIHPQNPDIVFVAALGRLWGTNDERGLFRTADGGANWEKVLYVDDKTGVVDVQFQPGNPDLLLAAAYERARDGFDSNDPAKKWGPGSGVYRSTDGGKTFAKVGAGLPSVDLGRIDIEFSRANPNVALAVIESSKIGQEPENAPYLGVQGEDAEVGARLTQIVEGGPAEQAGLKTGDIVIGFEDHTVQSYEDLIGRMREHLAGDTVKVEVSRERKSVEYEVTLARRPGSEEDKPAKEGGEAPAPAPAAEAEAPAPPAEAPPPAPPAETPPAEAPPPQETPPPAEELKRPGEEKRSTESRSPFEDFLGGQVANVQRQQGPEGHECGGIYRSEDGGATWRRINSVNPRPMYFSQIRVDPSDEKRIYVLGISLHRSEDGGETFDDGGAPDSVHVDHHALWIDPRDGRHMILGNDGGIYVTWDRGAVWEHLNRMAIGQFYHVAVDSRRDYRVYGGLQDNGTWGGPSRGADRGGPINEDWINLGGGDGFVCRVDPGDPDLVYFESQEGALGRVNLRTGERGSMRPRAPRGVRYRFNWQTPFILSHHNPSIFYTAGNYVFRSLSQGDDLKAISPEITNTDKGSASALAESPLDPAVLYAGSDDGALWVTKDGGVTWTNLFAPPAEQPAPEPAPAEQPAPEQPAPDKPADPLSGTWQAESFGGGGPRGDFSLDLKLGAEGAVSGGFSSQMADGELARGKFDAKKGELTASLEAEMFTAELRARLEGDVLKGSIDFGRGFAREFEARRATQAQQEDPYDWKRIAELLERPMWVSAIEPSRHEQGRVYLAIDGHRSNVDVPLLFVSEDFGQRWRPLAAGLPEGAGVTRVIREDIVNADVLYAGTEFGAFVSIDRGATWTSLNTNLPTVAVHEIAQHESAGEIVAATHGRSLWVLDVSALRQLSPKALADEFRLYRPNAVAYRRSAPQRGGTQNRFAGENPRTEASLCYSLGARAERVRLEVKDYTGRTLREFETAREPGVHVARWDLREAGGEGRRRRGPRVPPGTYLVLLSVGSRTQSQPLVVEGDPAQGGEDGWGDEDGP